MAFPIAPTSKTLAAQFRRDLTVLGGFGEFGAAVSKHEADDGHNQQRR
jgi:hypothetical protein